MPSSGKRVFYADRVFHVDENVYEPAEDSFFFAENLSIKSDAVVLDVGTGCGILGILAAARALRVIAIDFNPFAVRCAKENAVLNRATEKCSVVQGDLFMPVNPVRQFDTVLFNAPYLPTEDHEGDSWVEQAWSGGVSGRNVIDRFITEVPRYLNAGGQVFLLQSTLSGVEETLRRFRGSGLNANVAAQRDLPFFESLVLVVAGH